MSIRCLDQPSSCFLESYIDTDGKRCCSVTDATQLRSSANSQRILASSQSSDTSGTSSINPVYSQPSPSTIPPSSQPSNLSDLPQSIGPDYLLSMDVSTPDQRTVPHLLAFQSVTETEFVWGTTDSSSFIHSLDAAYHEVTH